ncbi:cysteine--tRNA ligase [bacterium]|nr:cysteine--tRNA ligase [bacterium]
MTTPRQIQFHDTKTGKVLNFEPLKKGEAKIYSCGPTVYNYAHIGNFRNFVFVDVLRRTLKLFGYKLIHVRNITDIDDKIIKKAAEEGISIGELSARYEKAFFDDCKYLNLEQVEHSPRATEHIDGMTDLVETLISKGFTYEREGSIYFRISKFKDYGKLSHIDLSAVRSGARVDSDEYSKEDARDFVLWKGRKEGEPYWETSFGAGRPGWHLECSAMSRNYLGETFDIHTGAEDLVFPHHENEIAQSEAANGKEYVKYWLHCAFLNMKDEKMSKSLGNIVTPRQLQKDGISGAAVRYFLLSVHYRKPLGFSMEGISAAATAVTRLRTFYNRVKKLVENLDKSDGSSNNRIEEYRQHYMHALADDLNTAKALGVLFDLVRTMNAAMDDENLTFEEAVETRNFIEEVDNVLGVIVSAEETVLPEKIEELIELRQKARNEKNFTEADRIRDQLEDWGILIEDTREGMRWRKG